MAGRKLSRRAIVSLAAAILLGAAMLCCNSTRAPLRIGGVLSLSGAAFYLGGEVRDGAQLAIEEINSWGGLNGRKLQLLVEDSASDAETGKKAFHNIESRHHPLFYLSTSSTVSMALAPLAEEARVMLVGLVVTSTAFPGQNQWAFRYYPTAENDIAPIIPILSMLKIKKLGVLHLNDEFGSSIFDILNREFAKIGGQAFSASFPANTEDFTPYFDRLRGFDAVYLNGFIPNLEAMFSFLEWHPLAKPLFSNNASAIPRIRAFPMTSGVYIGAPVIYNEDFRFAAEAKRKYEARYHKPFNHYAANGYDSIKLLAGLLEGQANTRLQVKTLLSEGFLYSGILGELSVKPGARAVSFPLVPARILDGRVVYLNLDIPASSQDAAEADGEHR